MPCATETPRRPHAGLGITEIQEKDMQALTSRINPRSANSRQCRRDANAGARPSGKADEAALGGGEAGAPSTRTRQAVAARPRRALLDPGTPFLEIGQLAATHVRRRCAVGWRDCRHRRIQGVACMVVANDRTVKGRHLLPD